MIYTFTNFAAATPSGLGALGVDGKAFLIQLATFVLAYLVLRRYAFGPILRVMNQRRETIDSSVKLTERLQKEQTELQKKVEKALHDARQEADGIIAGAQDASRQIVQEAETKARDKTAGILKEADSRIAQDAAQARRALEQEVVGLVAEATEAIIDEKLDAKKDVALIERVLKERQAA